MSDQKFQKGDKVIVKYHNRLVPATVNSFNRIYQTYTVFIDGTRSAANYPENEIQERTE